MLQRIPQHTPASWLWIFMAALLLNISVDAPDVMTLNKEDLTFNDQESIVELVVEKFLGYDNAITEQDDTDSNEQTQFKKSFSLDYFILPKLCTNSNADFFELKKQDSFPRTENPKQPCCKAINPPPEV